MKLETIFLIVNFLLLILLFGFFVVDGISIEVYEYTEDSQVPWFNFDIVKESNSVRGSGDMGLVGSNWSPKLQRCRENPKCKVFD
jgi:hypothetical protein